MSERRKQDWRPGQRPEFTEQAARLHLRRELRALDWRPQAIEAILSAIEGMDGVWSYGTVKAVQDLAAIYEEMVGREGGPPDRRW